MDKKTKKTLIKKLLELLINRWAFWTLGSIYMIHLLSKMDPMQALTPLIIIWCFLPFALDRWFNGQN